MYEDLDRPPLRDSRVRTSRGQGAGGGPRAEWRVEVVSATPSTNADVAARARAGEPPGLVLVAEHQTAGRGRLDRTWVSPPRAGLTMSLLLRPELRAERLPWVPLWGGAAVARALREQTGVDAVLKWPNDVLVGGRKLCGLLGEVPVPGVVVLGIGLNVTTRPDELPPGATSVALEGATADRDTLLRAVLRTLTDVLAERSPDGYRALCSTLGSRVRLELPGGRTVHGHADAVDDAGRLVVDGVAYGAGDVVHVRA